MKLSLPTKLANKLVWVPVIWFVKFCIPSSVFDALLCRNWLLSTPNLVTLWITLISLYISYEYCKHINQTMQNHVGCRVLQSHPPGLIDMCSVLCL
jgi:hypothetical protein